MKLVFLVPRMMRASIRCGMIWHDGYCNNKKEISEGFLNLGFRQPRDPLRSTRLIFDIFYITINNNNRYYTYKEFIL